MTPAKMNRGNACAACAGAALCLADGPIPDFEAGAIAGVWGMIG